MKLTFGYMSSVLLALTFVSSCQKKMLEVQSENHQGKDLVVAVSEDSFGSNEKIFSDVLKSCHENKMGQKILGIQQDIIELNSMELSKKMKARMALLDNFFTDVESQSDCAVVENVVKNYNSLTSVWERNSNHELSFFVHNHPLVKKEVAKVNDRFGALYIERQPGRDIRLTAAYEAWTGYWYPASAIHLLTGQNSPLGKFDKLLQRMRRSTGVLREERSFFSGLTNADTWEGHCHAWSMASVVYGEPLKPVELGGVTFSVADLKAIFTKAAAYTETAEYGIRYMGNAETDGTYQDLVPEAFHKLAVYHLENNIPFVLDDDAGPEVWTKPVVQMISRIKPAVGVANAVEVQSWLKLIRQRGKASEAGVKTNLIEHSSSLILKYRLYHEARPNSNGQYKVIRGEWIGDSVASHPDVIIVPNLDKPASDNSVLNKNLDVVQRLLRGSR